MATQNFSLVAGRTKLVTVNYRDPNTQLPVTITSATISFKAAKSIGRTAALSKATGGGGITITDGAGGVFLITLDPEDTEDLEGDYLWEAKITFADASVDSIRGIMTVEPALVP